MKHEEKRIINHTPQNLYNLVSDVKKYPEFLPWCSAARVRSRVLESNCEIMLADLVISFKVFSEKFGSKVILHPESKKIETESVSYTHLTLPTIYSV